MEVGGWRGVPAWCALGFAPSGLAGFPKLDRDGEKAGWNVLRWLKHGPSRVFRRNHAARRNSERKDESCLACPWSPAIPKSRWVPKASWHGERPAGFPKLNQHGERPAGLGSLLGIPLASPLRGSLGSQKPTFYRERPAGMDSLNPLSLPSTEKGRLDWTGFPSTWPISRVPKGRNFSRGL